MPDGGCTEEAEYVDGIITDRCPVMWYADCSILFQSFNWMERGFLPFSGGWADQPALFMDALNVVIEEVEAERRKEIERQHRAANNQMQLQE